MSATFIPALVIRHNNDVYQTEDLVVGVTMAIPTPGAGGVIDGDYWAVPINDFGIVNGFNFIPTTPDSIDPPTDQSFHIFRLTTRFGNDVWWVRGSTTFDGDSPANPGYIQAAQDAECCAEAPRSLPTDIPDLAGCQLMCQFNTDSPAQYFAVFALPARTGTTPNYFPYGSFNGVALTAASPTGYATSGTLVTFLNTSWGNVGTWTFANDVLMVTQTSGPGTDTICAQIIAINPSA